MISHRTRERRGRVPKMSKNLERLFKEGKCRDCAVVVTRMDFAKILGKFTKVKIQYESNSTPKTKKNEPLSPNSNARLKTKENGMVLIRRNAYNEHPVKELLSPKKAKVNDATPRQHSKTNESTPKHVKFSQSTPRQMNNILKENNRLKRTPIVKDKNSNIPSYESSRLKNNSRLKQYGIIFEDPSQSNNKSDTKSKILLQDLLPIINKSILPTEEWCIEYLPNKDEPTNDKVYDRIAAELEDLMYNEKSNDKPLEKPAVKAETTETKTDDFPSIMDILNDSSNENICKTNDQSTNIEFKTNLESSDVEAMLLGKSNESRKEGDQTSMDVDNSDVTNLIADVVQLNAIEQPASRSNNLPKVIVPEEIDNPHSPSILDEALQKGIEEHLPVPENHLKPVQSQINPSDAGDTSKVQEVVKKGVDNPNLKEIVKRPDITHVVFKKNIEGTSHKLVTCPRNLKYSIELEGKHVELIGAPKYISSLDDLQVLLQIVNDTELQSLYILY